MIEQIILISFIAFILFLFMSVVCFLWIENDLFIILTFFLSVSSFLVWYVFCSESSRFYRESCFSYMTQTPSSQWEYENKFWKIVRTNENIYIFNNDRQYTVETAEDGGFMVRDSHGRIIYIVSKNGDVTSL